MAPPFFLIRCKHGLQGVKKENLEWWTICITRVASKGSTRERGVLGKIERPREERDKIYVEGFILRAMIRVSASSVGLGRRSSLV